METIGINYHAILPETITGATAALLVTIAGYGEPLSEGQWRELAEAKNLSIHQLVLEVQPHQRSFVGTPGQIADEWAHYVRTRAVDGFNLSPHLVPGSIDDVVDRLVPELQERGVVAGDGPLWQPLTNLSAHAAHHAATAAGA